MYDRRKCQAIVSEANQPHISFKIKSFNLFNNKHFLELLHHLLTTKIFFYFPRPQNQYTTIVTISKMYEWNQYGGTAMP